MSDHVARYREQSIVTSAHAYQTELNNLPDSINDLIDMVNGLIIHFENDKAVLSEQIFQQRKHEVDSRLVSAMLDRIFYLDASPLDQPRPAVRRLLGTCRDTAVLLCSFMRHKGIAARVRYGFVHDLYQRDNPLHNHAVVEYWDGEWMLAESLMSCIRGSDTPFSPDDLPRTLYIAANEAWQQVQSGAQSAQTFSGHKLSEHRSVWLVRRIVLCDLASLAGYEPLIWDQWGRHYHFSRPQCVFNDGVLLDLFNRAGMADYRIDSQCHQLVEKFQEVAGISIGTEIHSFSPVLGRYSITV